MRYLSLLIFLFLPITNNNIIYLAYPASEPLSSNQLYLNQSHIPPIWNYETGNENVTIAILDTGEPAHEDIKISEAYAVDSSWNVNDTYGHSTQVTGIIGAIGDNELGISGIAWNVKIITIKISNDPNGVSNTYLMAQGIDLAISLNADIINLSYSVPFVSYPCEMAYLSDAIRKAQDNGILIIAASGNRGDNTVSCPAAMDGVLAVGSPTGGNYGEHLDLVARSFVYTTQGNGSYGVSLGTSFSTAQVSGVAGLLLSHNSKLTPIELMEALKQTTTRYDDTFRYGNGELNAFDALRFIDPTIPIYSVYLPIIYDS